jgi:hypothetical protein
MESSVKQKLCWNCEARVDFGVESCPSCGVYLSTSPLLEQSASVATNFSTPPYRYVAQEQDIKIPESPFNFQDQVEHTPAYEEKVETEEAGTPVVTELASPILWKLDLMPMGLLLAGSIFSLFGLVLLLFSTNGQLTLRWNGEYWYLYLLLGVPFLTFGWRALQRAYPEEDSPAQ